MPGNRRGFDKGWAVAALGAVGKVVKGERNYLGRLGNGIMRVCRVIVEKVKSAVGMPFMGPLYFLEFENGGTGYMALIDNGSQLNIVNQGMLESMEFEEEKYEGVTQHVKGIDGSPMKIRKWATFNAYMPTGAVVKVVAAVVDQVMCSLIFGQPFLIAGGMKVDCGNAVLETREGPVKLVVGGGQLERGGVSVVEITDVGEVECLQLKETNINGEQREQLLKLIKKYHVLWEGDRIGRARTVKHAIQLDKEGIIRDFPRQYTEDQRQEIKTQVDSMLREGIIQASRSPHASEIVLAKKKDADGTFTGWRMCIDFRKINDHTLKDAYPLPRINDLLRSVKSSRYFVTVDLKAGYLQIPLEEGSRKYTAFRCFLGLFEFLVMPFGLTNAPATFQRMVDTLFGDLYFRGVSAYLDDILIHGATFEETMGKLEIVLERLAQEGLTINLKKTTFFPKTLRYLGQVIEDGVLSPNKVRVEALDRIEKPRNVYEVRRLLGMLGHYQIYIQDFCGLMVPVFALLKGVKNSKRNNKREGVTWEVEHDGAVQEAIRRLKGSTLRIPLEGDEFLMETDASSTAVGAVLSCRQKGGPWAPVEFMSKALGKTEKKWPTRDREAYAIVYGLKKFDQFLRGRHFVIHTDHQSLRWILTAKGDRVARWASRLSEFRFDILHKSSKQLEHVDYFSRFVDLAEDFDIEDRMVPCVNMLLATRERLPTIADISRAQQEQGGVNGKGYVEKGGLIYYHSRIWVPPVLRNAVIASCHSLAPYRHPGVKKTSRIIQRVFNWPGLFKDVVNYLKGCLFCQQTKAGIEKLQGLFKIHPMVGPFHMVYMDFYECTFNRVRRKVLTMIDHFTKWAECVPVVATTADVIACAFTCNWICRFGAPKVAMHDNDKTFVSDAMDQFKSQWGIAGLTSTPYHPEGNAVIESFHRTLNKGLAHFEIERRSTMDFEEALQLVVYSYRCTLHLTTGESPAFLTYGVDLRAPADNDWRFERCTAGRQRLQYLNNMRLEIQWKAREAREQAIERKNEGRYDRVFEEGDLVLVRATDHDRLRMAHATGDHRHKLIPKWSVPQRVITVYPGGKKALVRNLLTGFQRIVHIQNARFIAAPTSELQQKEWELTLSKPLESMFDGTVREEKLRRFWEQIHYPQVEELDRPVAKRARES